VHVTPIDEACFRLPSRRFGDHQQYLCSWSDLDALHAPNEVQYTEKFGGGRTLERTQDDVQLLYHYAKGVSKNVFSFSMEVITRG